MTEHKDKGYHSKSEMKRVECQKGHTDKERLDWLDTLAAREKKLTRTYTKQLSTDIHLAAKLVSVLVRDERGYVCSNGHGETIREAIDEAMRDK